MNVRLVVERGARRRTLHLQPPVAVVGRARGNAVRIPSAEVSRQHCQLLLQDGRVRVQDLDSVNGTLLNGKPVRGIAEVRSGDSLRVGPVTFAIEYDRKPSARTLPPAGPADIFDQLEQLADGDVVLDMDEEAVPMLEDVEEAEVPTLEPVDEDEPWAMPQGDAFRDMLSQLEDEEDDPPPPPRKRR